MAILSQFTIELRFKSKSRIFLLFLIFYKKYVIIYIERNDKKERIILGYTKMATTALPLGDIFVNKDANEITEEFNSVNKPAHYTEGRKYEPIDVIEDWNLGFCAGNALKYISRAGRKSSGSLSKKEKTIEDIDKAIWYLQRYKKEIAESKDEAN